MVIKIPAPAWALGLEELYACLETDPAVGLSNEEVAKRQKQHGFNYFLPGAGPGSRFKKGNVPEEPRTTVLRNGTMSKITYSQLVPGDIIYFGVTDGQILCDARLIESTGLEISDTVLTGCASYSKKDASVTLPKDSKGYLDEIVNMVFAPSDIVKGEGKAVVIATGKNTEIYKISTRVG